MDTNITCRCGRVIPVAEGQAGSSVLCECGGSVFVPSLSILRAMELVEPHPLPVSYVPRFETITPISNTIQEIIAPTCAHLRAEHGPPSVRHMLVMVALTADALWLQGTWRLRSIKLHGLAVERNGPGHQLGLALGPERGGERLTLTFDTAAEVARWFEKIQACQSKLAARRAGRRSNRPRGRGPRPASAGSTVRGSGSRRVHASLARDGGSRHPASGRTDWRRCDHQLRAHQVPGNGLASPPGHRSRRARRRRRKPQETAMEVVRGGGLGFDTRNAHPARSGGDSWFCRRRALAGQDPLDRSNGRDVLRVDRVGRSVPGSVLRLATRRGCSASGFALARVTAPGRTCRAGRDDGAGPCGDRGPFTRANDLGNRGPSAHDDDGRRPG